MTLSHGLLDLVASCTFDSDAKPLPKLERPLDEPDVEVSTETGYHYNDTRRGKIMNLLTQANGRWIELAEIMTRTDLSFSKIREPLRGLVNEKLIQRREANGVHSWRIDPSKPVSKVLQRRRAVKESRERVLRLVESAGKGGILRRQVDAALGIAASTALNHLQTLEGHGLVHTKRDNTCSRWFAGPGE